MNRSIQMRAIMPDKVHAKSPRELIAALPQYPAQGIRESIAEMFRRGIIARIGNKSAGYRYFVARDVKRKAYATPQERAAGKKLTDAAANRRKKRPLEEWRAEQAARADAHNSPEAQESRRVKRVERQRERRRNLTEAERRAQQDRANALQRARRRVQAIKHAVECAADKAATAAALEAKRQQRESEKRAAFAQREAKRKLTQPQRIMASSPPARSVRFDKMKPAPVPVRFQSLDDYIANGGQIERIPSVWDRRAA